MGLGLGGAVQTRCPWAPGKRTPSRCPALVPTTPVPPLGGPATPEPGSLTPLKPAHPQLQVGTCLSCCHFPCLLGVMSPSWNLLGSPFLPGALPTCRSPSSNWGSLGSSWPGAVRRVLVHPKDPSPTTFTLGCWFDVCLSPLTWLPRPLARGKHSGSQVANGLFLAVTMVPSGRR